MTGDGRSLADREDTREPELITIVDGFTGCTDINPDVCACGQDDSVWCTGGQGVPARHDRRWPETWRTAGLDCRGGADLRPGG